MKEMKSVKNLLLEWDQASTAVRLGILSNFIEKFQGNTSNELEEELQYGASLFLNRLTTWIRLSYMMGKCISLQLQAINVFLSATNGQKYILEFIEVGGILTLLEIIGLRQSSEEDKSQCLLLLCSICSAGRQYKEVVCESYGVRAVSECLAKSTLEETVTHAKVLLQMLAEGNQKYEQQVYKGLIALLPSTSPKAQQMAIQNLRLVQKPLKSANPSLIAPLLNLLSSNHLEVQYEVIEFSRELMDFDVKEQLLDVLVQSLRPSREEISKANSIAKCKKKGKNDSTILPMFTKQAAAAKAIGILARDSSATGVLLLKLHAVPYLLHAMGNVDHPDSQKQAALSLEYFLRVFPNITESVKQSMGEELFELYMADPENLYVSLNAVQADVLLSNKM